MGSPHAWQPNASAAVIMLHPCLHHACSQNETEKEKASPQTLTSLLLGPVPLSPSGRRFGVVVTSLLSDCEYGQDVKNLFRSMDGACIGFTVGMYLER
jgi:hypothetical protein